MARTTLVVSRMTERMTPDELVKAAVKIYGKKHWVKFLAEKLGKDQTTVRRWKRGAIAIPGYVSLLLENIEKERKLEKLTSKLARQLR